MGAEQFATVVTADNPRGAFIEAAQNARWENGHGGYAGTIAKNTEFRAFGKI